MQYCVKFFNRESGDFVGYYKEVGKNCITAMPNGTKYFNTLEQAMTVAREHDGGFLRDRDKHYYTTVCVIYCDSRREPKENKYNQEFSEEEREYAINTVIRKSGNFIEG